MESEQSLLQGEVACPCCNGHLLFNVKLRFSCELWVDRVVPDDGGTGGTQGGRIAPSSSSLGPIAPSSCPVVHTSVAVIAGDASVLEREKGVHQQEGGTDAHVAPDLRVPKSVASAQVSGIISKRAMARFNGAS